MSKHESTTLATVSAVCTHPSFLNQNGSTPRLIFTPSTCFIKLKNIRPHGGWQYNLNLSVILLLVCSRDCDRIRVSWSSCCPNFNYKIDPGTQGNVRPCPTLAVSQLRYPESLNTLTSHAIFVTLLPLQQQHWVLAASWKANRKSSPDVAIADPQRQNLRHVLI